MKERQLELAYEADRGFDVYRVGDTMKRHYPGFHDGVPEYPATSRWLSSIFRSLRLTLIRVH